MIRYHLYHAARILGDIHAVETGRVPQRIVRRIVYRKAFHLADWLCKLLKVSR